MRNQYNLSHNVSITGHIGRNQCVTVIPVIAGDGIELSIDGIFRLATTRQEIVSECQVDICAFFVKYQHIINVNSGSTDYWDRQLKLGLQLDTEEPTFINVNPGDRNAFYLGIRETGAFVGTHLVRAHNFVFQRAYCVPSTNGNGAWAATDLNYFPSGTLSEAVNHRKYGPRCARLPHILNGATVVNQPRADGLGRQYSDADWGVLIPQDTPAAGTALLDIRDLEQIKSRYKSVQEQNYFATFYDDVIKKKWGTKVNTDADKQPDHCGRNTMFISGADVNGTGDANLGSFVGKTLGRVGFKMPRKTFQQHGLLLIYMLPRFPLAHTREQHPLLASTTWDPKKMLADPTVMAAEPVEAFDPGRWLAGGSLWTPNINALQQPYGQEYRYQPNRIDPIFESLDGFPYTQWDSANYNDWYYYRDNEYDDVFQDSMLGHWRSYMQVTASRFSTLPAPTTSIMAGAN